MIQREEIRETLKTEDPEEIAKKSGASFQEGEIRLEMLGEEFLVKAPNYEVNKAGDSAGDHLKELILNYLSLADYPCGSGDWIGFSEIPHGEFYSSNFKKNTESRLTRVFQNRRDEFVRVAKDLSGEEIDMGDSGFAFQALPGFKIAIVFWSGGDEFQDKVNVLFEKTATKCLSTEGLSILGKTLCNKFIDKAEEPKI
ncbi:MAG: DUF3786 domain-containing protein [Candidatus Bipolaricaulia bacterium]